MKTVRDASCFVFESFWVLEDDPPQWKQLGTVVNDLPAFGLLVQPWIPKDHVLLFLRAPKWMESYFDIFRQVLIALRRGIRIHQKANFTRSCMKNLLHSLDYLDLIFARFDFSYQRAHSAKDDWAWTNMAPKLFKEGLCFLLCRRPRLEFTFNLF